MQSTENFKDMNVLFNMEVKQCQDRQKWRDPVAPFGKKERKKERSDEIEK